MSDPRPAPGPAPIPGADDVQRAVRLAGALAECGVISLTITASGGQARLLTSGNTDLPGVLAALAGASADLNAGHPVGGSIRVRIEPTGWTWTGAGALADMFRARLKGGPGD